MHVCIASSQSMMLVRSVAVLAKESAQDQLVQLRRQTRARPPARAQHQRQHPHPGARHVQHGPDILVAVLGSQSQRRVLIL